MAGTARALIDLHLAVVRVGQLLREKIEQHLISQLVLHSKLTVSADKFITKS